MDIDFNSIFDRSQPLNDRIYGMVIATVTNNKDPDKLGRVKLKYPWLSEDIESDWARIVTPMSGNQFGFFILPEVGDEVLVGFEHGQIELPFVMGSLWNGQDKPPEVNEDGKNNLRLIKSRSGHIIRLDDTDGSEKIEILDKSNKNTIVIDTANNTITIKADADISIQSANGKLTLMGKKGIDLQSDDAVRINSKKDFEVTSNAAVKVKASGNMDLNASGNMTIKGTKVNIN